MLERKKIQGLNDYFVELQARQDKGVYFYRINGYSDEVREFLKRYYDAARKNGVVIEGRIPNPNEQNLAYYSEMMGMDFQLNMEFMVTGLKKWLPRMNEVQRQNVASSLFRSLENMKQSGKTDNMLKNAYIKFMCWLYYRFERIVHQLGSTPLPKILYEGQISHYELMLLSIISNAGCDVVLLQYAGDQPYRSVDPSSAFSDEWIQEGLGAFPSGFSIQVIRKEIQEDFDQERLYGQRSSIKPCTNAWITGKGLEDIKTVVTQRGSDPGFFYNCFCRINGAEDKLTYVNELLQFQQELKMAKRHVVILSESIPSPSPDEIAGIKRSNYTTRDQMIMDLSGNIQYTANMELQRMIHTAFVDIVLQESRRSDMNLNKLTNKAVYLLCWLKRYLPELFVNWKMPEIGCFIYMGGCRNSNESLFVRFLAKLPIDILLLCPNLNQRCSLEDPLLYEVNYSESVSISKFPEQGTQVQIGTAAYHAERDLDTLMYQDTGMYRNRQYGKANVITLQTMYEEIKILWNEELRYRPNFSTVDGVVNLPVIYAKISGVKDGQTDAYWASVKELITEDTLVIKNPPYLLPDQQNPMKAYATEFYKNGRLQKERIKNHPKYPYGILREDMQEVILEKLQLMIQQKMIKGIGENGMEYTVIAQVLNLQKEIVRKIQNFDFTKKNPKIIYINTGENILTIEDTIMVAFLNLIGFDILFFVPTGYRSIEKFFTKHTMEDHQIGEYLYDLQIPDLNTLSVNGTRSSWFDKFFH